MSRTGSISGWFAPKNLWLRAALGALKFALILCLANLACLRASADVGVVLNESLDEDFDRISSTGHSAIYFSRICPESPVKLRLCRPDEPGSILSNYINIGEDQLFEWNIVPLNIYLYGVEDPANRSLFASYKIKRLLEDRYRQKYLAAYCTSPSCLNSPKAEWREMVAATMIRGVHIFTIKTTLEQDQKFIAEFNESANKNRFNGVTRNCADFTKHIINAYFPHSTKADYLNDFGMTSPKAVARTFTHYALHHPDSQFRVMHFAQVPGTTKRSRIVRSGTEQLFHSGKLLVPMVLISYYSVPVVTTSYFTTARFNAEKQFEKHPSSLLPPDGGLSAQDLQQQIVGSPAQWKELRKSLDSVVAENAPGNSRNDLTHFFKRLDETGTPFLAENGAAWIDMSDDKKTARVGLSASNILAASSDAEMSFDFLLARSSYVLKSPKHARETMVEFNQDWANLQRASAQNALRSNPLAAAMVQRTFAAPNSEGSASLLAAHATASPTRTTQ